MKTHPIDFSELEKALNSLEKGLQQPKNEFTRDASIQRFEFSFELAWKTAKKALLLASIESLAPRFVIRDIGQQKWIQDVDLWMTFLNNRNLTSHTYNEKTADQVYEAAKLFLPECRNLITHLKTLKFPK